MAWTTIDRPSSWPGGAMANDEHLNLLKQGAVTWNGWRRDHASIRPDLSHADLYCADLDGANLGGAHLRAADLRGAHLRGADLSSADLSEASFSGFGLHTSIPRLAKPGLMKLGITA